METWTEAVRAGAVSGSWAAVVSGGALAVCAALEGTRPLSPLNGQMHGEVRARTSMPAELGRAGATTALAAVVDFGLTPKRFQPGFDKHLSPGSVAAVYAAFALGLAAARMRRHHATDREDD